MPHFPKIETFQLLAADHQLVPVYRCLLCDALTPVSAFQRVDDGGSACLFESVIGGEKVGRYSFLATKPYAELSARGNRVTLKTSDGTTEYDAADPLDELRKQLDALNAAHLPQLPPFEAGAIGYAGYDVVRYTENLPNPPPDDRQLPDLCFGFYDEMIVFDNVTKTMFVIVMARIDDAEPNSVAPYEDAKLRVDRLVEKLSVPSDALTCEDIDTTGAPEISFTSNFEQTEFEDAVRTCVEYIRAGDIFQVVISQRLECEVSASPFDIYRTLRVVNPSPFMFFLRTPDVTLVGSSPEILCRVVDGELTVRPLAGTRRRGKNAEEDELLAEELLADPKERAEHVMLVDLGRNDVGRVAVYGSVELSDVMSIERYSHVMHITSNVTGRLTPENNAFDALRACLPAGTVSGAPKVRAMEVIDELERHRRGPYAGAVGYFDFAGNMDTCIALRTLGVQGSMVYIQVGAGIVADSDPSSEYEETLNKARGLLKAIEITEARVGPNPTP